MFAIIISLALLSPGPAIDASATQYYLSETLMSTFDARKISSVNFAMFPTNGEPYTSKYTASEIDRYVQQADALLYPIRDVWLPGIPLLDVQEGILNYEDSGHIDYFEEQILPDLRTARDLYIFLWDYLDSAGDGEIPDRHFLQNEIKSKLLEALRTEAKILIIFGNEFLVDALDYRWSSETYLGGEVLLVEELQDLAKALPQFTDAVNVYSQFMFELIGIESQTRIGSWYEKEDYELLNHAAARKAKTYWEIGRRRVLLGDDSPDEPPQGSAEWFYNVGGFATYLELAALATLQGVDEHGKPKFFSYGGEDLSAQLTLLRAGIHSINEGMNPFGYPEEYVPLHDFDELYEFTRDILLPKAFEDEEEACKARRDWEKTLEGARQELEAKLDTIYDEMLILCGDGIGHCDGPDNPDCDCDGGSIAESGADLNTKKAELMLTLSEYQAIGSKIVNEIDRLSAHEALIWKGEESVALLTFVRDLIDSIELEAGISVPVFPDKAGLEGGVDTGKVIDDREGKFFDVDFETVISISIYVDGPDLFASITYNPKTELIEKLDVLISVLETMEDLALEGIETETYVKNLLVDMGVKLAELDVRVADINGLAVRYINQVDRLFYLASEYVNEQVESLQDAHELLIYRILREDLTFRAEKSLLKAGQFSYLTARALEYEQAADIQWCRDDIFQYRTCSDIDDYLEELPPFRWCADLGAPSWHTYEISLWRDILRLDDDDGTRSEEEKEEIFRAFISEHITGECLEFEFDISVFGKWARPPSTAIMRKIAPYNDHPQGVAVDIVYVAGDPGIVWTYFCRDGTHSMFKDCREELREYEIGRTTTIGFGDTGDIYHISTSDSIVAGVEDPWGQLIREGNYTDLFQNRSLAAGYSLRICLEDVPYIDFNLVEDIVFNFGTEYHTAQEPPFCPAEYCSNCP